MSKTLKDRPITYEKDDSQRKEKDRSSRFAFKSSIQYLDPDEWEDLELEIFEKM